MKADFQGEIVNNQETKKPIKILITDFFKKYLTERTFFLYVVLFMTTMPVGELITQLHDRQYVTQPIIHAFFGFVGLIMGIGWLFTNQDIKKWKVSDILYWTLIFFAAVALAFSKDSYNSTAGFSYDEWFVNFLGYFSLMFSATRIESYEYRKKILYVFAGLALCESFICVLQTLDLWVMPAACDPEVHTEGHLAFGLTQHQNFYAGLSVLFTGACMGLCIFSNTRKKSLRLLILTGFVFYGSLRTSARIAWVGNFTLVVFYLVSLLIVRKKCTNKVDTKPIVNRFCAVVVVMVAVIGFTMLTWGELQREVEQSVNEFESEDIGRYGNGRFYIWKFGLKTVPDNWLTGIGLDNYKWAFFSNPEFDEDTMWYQDKGHNEYIHVLVTEGVPALINYLFLLVFAMTTAIKNIVRMEDRKQQILTWIFLGMFTGYVVQAMVNSSVINTAMYFWVTIGMIIPRWSQKNIGRNPQD